MPPNINFMQVIRCKHCNSSGVDFGNTSVTVNYKTSNRVCDHCNNVQTDTKSDFFCSEKCFKDWIYLKLTRDIDG